MRSIAHTYTRAPFIFSWLPGCKVVNEIYEAFDLFVCWLLCSVVDSFDGVLLALLLERDTFAIECRFRFSEQMYEMRWTNMPIYTRTESARGRKWDPSTCLGTGKKCAAWTKCINGVSQMNMRKFAQFRLKGIFPICYAMPMCAIDSHWFRNTCISAFRGTHWKLYLFTCIQAFARVDWDATESVAFSKNPFQLVFLS